MSHFTVLVIGNEVNEQLAPFDENIMVPEYVDGIVSDDDKMQFLDYYEGEEIEKFPEYYKKYGQEWNDNSWRKNEDGIWCKYGTYNPNSKWDWYQVGGRWSGFFKLKMVNGAFPESKTGEPGTSTEPNNDSSRCDITLKRNIDFDGMRKEVGDEALVRYRKVMAVVGDSLKNFRTWEETKAPYPTKEALLPVIDVLRDQYQSQEAKRRLDSDIWYVYLDNYLISEEEYVANARRSAISTFAVLKDGVWYERGNMGWWGIATNEKDITEWDMQFEKLLESLPDDTVLTIVDCHI